MSKRALVIDDSKAMRRILVKILTEAGFITSEAGDGREALAQLRNQPLPELALVDWNMPEINGYEFVCQVRAQPRYDAVKLMMVTTETEMSHVANALQAGANEYVMKPFTKDVIMEKLQLLGLRE